MKMGYAHRMDRVLWFNPALVSQADVESIRAGVGLVKAEYGKAWGFYEEKPDWWVPSSKYLEPPYVTDGWTNVSAHGDIGPVWVQDAVKWEIE